MKAAITVAILLTACVLANEDIEARRQRIRTYRQECVEETKVDPELVDNADRGQFSDDKHLKCFAKCFYVKAGFITEKGELLLDVIQAKMPPEQNRELALRYLEKCKDLKGADACETAYIIHKCYFELAHGIVGNN